MERYLRVKGTTCAAMTSRPRTAVCSGMKRYFSRESCRSRCTMYRSVSTARGTKRYLLVKAIVRHT